MLNSKFIGLDGMRGIAAIFVFIRHTSDYWGSLNIFHSYLAVDVFFILSGFVIAHAYEKRFEQKTMTQSTFIITRIIRLYPMYCLGILLGIALTLIKLSKGITVFSIDESLLTFTIILSLLFLPANINPGQNLFPLNGASWSLFYELMANCIYGVIRKLLSIRTLLGILITTGLILAYCSYKAKGLDIGSMGGVKSIFAASMRANFGIFYGILLHKLYLKGFHTPKLLNIQLLPLLLMSAIFLIPNAGPFNWLFDLIAITLILPVCVFWTANTDCKQQLVKAFLFLGITSYPLYVLHGPISEFGKMIFQNTIEDNQPLSGAIFICVLLITCILIVRFIDEPIRATLNKLFLKK